jgi:uncharacterized membrane protein YgcG
MNTMPLELLLTHAVNIEYGMYERSFSGLQVSRDAMKKTLLISWIVFLLIAIPVHAQGSEPPIPSVPPKGTYVLDELDWLTEAQERNINNTVLQLDRDGLAEIAVVTMNNCGADKEAFRKSLFDTWGIGHVDDNDGLLILVCWYEGDASRRSVEQIYGPGLNGVLSSQKTDRVAQDEFVPAFQANKPGDGLVNMIRSYNILLRGRGRSNNLLTSMVQFFKELDETVQMILMFLVILVVIWGGHRFIPKSFREHFRSETGRDGSRDGDNSDRGFGGGSSDGGGGSSTRF